MAVTRSKTIFVGLSGGVDSAVSAALLKQRNEKVVGVFFASWSTDFAPSKCDQATDRRDAARVAAHLNIPFLVLPCAQEYRDRVLQVFLADIQAGRTPNPDALCNQEIKFSLFRDLALAAGADSIATGHYAQIASASQPVVSRAVDENKDQSYFLARVSTSQLTSVEFPIGHLTKPQVRELAARLHLPVADKPDSQGLCFVGQIRLPEFIRSFFTPTPGPIITYDGQHLGSHTGLADYTIGQRHGLNLGGGQPLYVQAKELATNTLIVTHDLLALETTTIAIRDILRHDTNVDWRECRVQIRYRSAAQPIRDVAFHGDTAVITTDLPIVAVSAGQVAALYDRTNRLIASGILS